MAIVHVLVLLVVGGVFDTSLSDLVGEFDFWCRYVAAALRSKPI